MFSPVRDLKERQGLQANKLYHGVVVNNDDPKLYRRIRVRVAQLFDGIPDDKLPWAIPIDHQTDGASICSGTCAIPKVGTRVMVEFQEGNPLFPMYSQTYLTEFKNILEESKRNYPDRVVHRFQNKAMMVVDTKTNEVFLRNPGDLHIYIDGNVHLEIKGNVVEKIHGNRDILVKGNLQQTVEGNRVTSIEGSDTQIVKGTSHTRSNGDSTTEANGGFTQYLKGNVTQVIDGTHNVHVKKDSTMLVDGDHSHFVQKNSTEVVKGDHNQRIEGNSTIASTNMQLSGTEGFSLGVKDGEGTASIKGSVFASGTIIDQAGNTENHGHF